MRYLIDPHNITNYNRSKRELQTFWLFCVLVAGKNSVIQARKLNDFLSEAPYNQLPLVYIDNLLGSHNLHEKMVEHKLGQYGRLYKCFEDSMQYSDLLDVVGVGDLESIYGVGPKTARFFLLHTRKDQQHAVLDTHILRWMGKQFDVRLPKATPQGKLYQRIERMFLNYCREQNLSPAELDLRIWSSAAI